MRAAETFDEARARLVETLVVQLDELAGFCQKSRAYLERDRLYELLLEYEPDHKDARKMLGYKWDRKAEEWTRPREYRAPKNVDHEAALEALERRAALLQAHADGVVRALEEHRDELTDARFRAEVFALLVLDPDDERLRGFLGQVKADDEGGASSGWVLAETRHARARRTVLREWKKELRDGAPPGEPGAPTEAEQALGLSWRKVLQTERVRVLCTGEEREALDALQSCHQVCTLVTRVFGGEFEPAYTVYLVDSDAARDKLLEQHPAVDPAKVEFLKSVQGGTISWGEFGQWGPHRDQRVDGAVRQVVSRYMLQTFRTGDKLGWVHEGFGMYLTHLLIGTRLTFYIRQTEYEEGQLDRRKLTDPDSDWLRLAAGVLKGSKSPSLPFTLGRDVNTLTTEDLLASYALTAFLIEGHEPGLAVRVLTRVGAGENSVTVLEQELGYDHETLKQRLIAWLGELKK